MPFQHVSLRRDRCRDQALGSGRKSSQSPRTLVEMQSTSDSCHHCGSKEVAQILYGLPGNEAMAAAGRGEVVLGGCCVSPDDPTHICRACGSEWATSEQVVATAISEVFADYFSNWNISLPPGAVAAMGRGSIYKAGWNIHYRFDMEDERVMEFYATHHMTDDRRLRIHASGKTEHRPSIQTFMIVGKEDEYREHNRRVVEELRLLGLYPEGDINAFLRTNDVAPPGRSR
jgi:hypothetical protein